LTALHDREVETGGFSLLDEFFRWVTGRTADQEGADFFPLKITERLIDLLF
jgi:hypothetical protein